MSAIVSRGVALMGQKQWLLLLLMMSVQSLPMLPLLLGKQLSM